MHQPHSRWQRHNRVPLAEHVINVFLAFVLLMCGAWAIAIVVWTFAAAAALLRYAFGT